MKIKPVKPKRKSKKIRDLEKKIAEKRAEFEAGQKKENNNGKETMETT